MRRIILFTLILSTLIFIRCSKEKKSPLEKFIEESATLSDTLVGDFMIYSGQETSEDTSGAAIFAGPAFEELVMDKDNRFAVRIRFEENEVKTDSMTFHGMASQMNHGTGTWADVGDSLELTFIMNNMGWFKNENNQGRVEFVDDRTMRFSKSLDEIWIGEILCKRK